MKVDGKDSSTRIEKSIPRKAIEFFLQEYKGETNEMKNFRRR